MEEIRFFIREEPYGWLSNFERTQFIVDGKIYPTNEHFYQSHKPIDPVHSKYIREAPNATVAMVLGRAYEHDKYLKKYTIKNWDDIKRFVMLTGLRQKFKNPKLRKLLVSTRDAILHEDNPDDFYWSIADGTGKSWLGKLLMQVRDELQSSSGSTDQSSSSKETT